MTKELFEQTFDVRVISKKESLFMRVLGVLLWPFTPNFMTHFFTTYRFPFRKGIIAYPDGLDPMEYYDVLEHELMHVDQQRTTWGLFKSALLASIFPLPILFSGRWFIERHCYLRDIKKNIITIDQAVYILWNFYGFVWPKSLMREWFEENMKAV